MSARQGPPSASAAAGDLIAHRRQHLAAAYRRVADAALHAAQTCSDPDGDLAAEQSAAKAVEGRLLTVHEAHVLLRATRTGIGKAASKRSAA